MGNQHIENLITQCSPPYHFWGGGEGQNWAKYGDHLNPAHLNSHVSVCENLSFYYFQTME